LFQAEVTRQLCDGSERRAERRFGWGRVTITKGLREQDHEFQCVGHFTARGRKRWEDKNPQLAQDIRDLVEPRSQTHPELKLDRCYTNMSAGEVLEALQTQKGYLKADLPHVRTMRDILNRMNYRLKRICKAKPLKKTPLTNAIFANVQAVKAQMKPLPPPTPTPANVAAVKAQMQLLSPPTPTLANVPAVEDPVKRPSPPLEIAATDLLAEVAKVEVKPPLPTPAIADAQALQDRVKRQSETLELSMDTKAKVNEGDYARGGENPDRVRR
jgi:hypothetical protein